MPTKQQATPETSLRRLVSQALSGLWLKTWHEDREINPGVPDLSYVITGGYYETGWLELKRVEAASKTGKIRFHIEPSQHRWIAAHCEMVPVHFLVGVGDVSWLVRGDCHQILDTPIDASMLDHISLAKMNPDTMRVVLYRALRTLTTRVRYAR